MSDAARKPKYEMDPPNITALASLLFGRKSVYCTLLCDGNVTIQLKVEQSFEINIDKLNQIAVYFGVLLDQVDINSVPYMNQIAIHVQRNRKGLA